MSINLTPRDNREKNQHGEVPTFYELLSPPPHRMTIDVSDVQARPFSVSELQDFCCA